MRYSGGADLHHPFRRCHGLPLALSQGNRTCPPPRIRCGWGVRRRSANPALARLGGVTKRAALLARIGVSQRRSDPNQAGLAVSLVAREWLASIGGTATDRSVVMQINGA